MKSTPKKEESKLSVLFKKTICDIKAAFDSIHILLYRDLLLSFLAFGEVTTNEYLVGLWVHLSDPFTAIMIKPIQHFVCLLSFS